MTTKRYDENFKKSIVSLHENGRAFNSLFGNHPIISYPRISCKKRFYTS